MKRNNLKISILNNSFIDKLRIGAEFDEHEYQTLCDSLIEFKDVVKYDTSIDKELMLTLYCIPQVVYNAFQYFSENNTTNKEFIMKVEEAWIQLDQLVMEILA